MLEIERYKHHAAIHVHESNDSIMLDEYDSSASVKHLNILGTGVHFYKVDETFSHQLDKVFIKSSGLKEAADGIVFYEGADGQKTMLVCEMKSSIGALQKAVGQLKTSFVKACMLLSIYDDFQLQDYKVYFITTSTEDSFDNSVGQIQLLEASMRKPLQELTFNLWKHSVYTTRLGVPGLTMSPDFKNMIQQCPIHFVCARTTTDTAKLNITDI